MTYLYTFAGLYLLVLLLGALCTFRDRPKPAISLTVLLTWFMVLLISLGMGWLVIAWGTRLLDVVAGAF